MAGCRPQPIPPRSRKTSPFSEAAFPIGMFAQTALRHVGVLIDRHERNQFAVLIPTTWATSFTGLLVDHLAKAA